MMKNIISFILSFILSILIILVQLILSYIVYVDNKDTIILHLENSGYFQGTASNINQEISKYTQQSGLPEHIFTDLVTIDMVKSTIISYINIIYSNSNNYNINTDEIGNQFKQRVNNYIASQGILLDTYSQHNIDNFENILRNVYSDNIIPNIKVDFISNVINIIHNYIYYVLIGLMFLIIILIYILGVFLKKYELISCAFFTSGLYILIGVFIIKSFKVINLFYFGTQSFALFIRNYINSILEDFIKFGFFIFLLGIVTILLKYKNKIFKKLEIN